LKINRLIAVTLAFVLVAGIGSFEWAFAVIDDYATTDEVFPSSPLNTRQESVFSTETVNLLTNGDFETGDFAAWTQFLTTNGVTNPNVVLFDTDGDTVATQSAQFKVGQVIFEGPPFFVDFRGGGILQTINTAGGTITISADIASDLPSTAISGNLEGGLFKLFFDGVEMDSHDFASINVGLTERSTLNAVINGVTPGSHEVKIEVTRPALQNVNTPFQYIDNVIVEGDSLLVGGGHLQIDNTALLLAVLQTPAVWMISMFSALGIGAFLLTRNPYNVRNIKIILRDYLNRL